MTRPPISKSWCKWIISPDNCVFLSLISNKCCSFGCETSENVCASSQRRCLRIGFINQSGVIHIEWSTTLILHWQIICAIIGRLSRCKRCRFSDLLGMLCLGEREFSYLINFTSEVGFCRSQNKGATRNREENLSKVFLNPALIHHLICFRLNRFDFDLFYPFKWSQHEKSTLIFTIWSTGGKNPFNFDTESWPLFVSTPNRVTPM